MPRALHEFSTDRHKILTRSYQYIKEQYASAHTLVAIGFPFSCVNVSYVNVRVNGPHLSRGFQVSFYDRSPSITPEYWLREVVHKNYLGNKTLKQTLTLSLSD